MFVWVGAVLCNYVMCVCLYQYLRFQVVSYDYRIATKINCTNATESLCSLDWWWTRPASYKSCCVPQSKSAIPSNLLQFSAKCKTYHCSTSYYHHVIGLEQYMLQHFNDSNEMKKVAKDLSLSYKQT